MWSIRAKYCLGLIPQAPVTSEVPLEVSMDAGSAPIHQCVCLDWSLAIYSLSGGVHNHDIPHSYRRRLSQWEEMNILWQTHWSSHLISHWNSALLPFTCNGNRNRWVGMGVSHQHDHTIPPFSFFKSALLAILNLFQYDIPLFCTKYNYTVLTHWHNDPQILL